MNAELNCKIKQLEYDDLKKIVEVHVKAFPSFFLTFLGPSFLKQFYKSFIEDEQGIGFVAIDTELKKNLGVVVGPLNPKGYFKRLLRRKWYVFCLASLSAVTKKPSVIKRLFRAVFYRGESPKDMERSLLSSIAILPEAQGKGVGRLLVSEWLKEAKIRGSKGAFLTTDKKNNEAVNGFYQKLGWKIESVYTTPEGREMNRYIYDFLQE